jgi:hypothetical protein
MSALVRENLVLVAAAEGCRKDLDRQQVGDSREKQTQEEERILRLLVLRRHHFRNESMCIGISSFV